MKATPPSSDDQNRGPAKGRSPILPAVVLLICSLLVAGLVAELASRWVLDNGMNFDLEMWKYAKDIKRVRSNPEIAHEHTPGTSGVFMGVAVSINSMGLRDREYPLEKPPDSVRVLMLGDSLTFGWGVKLEDTPAKILESTLNRDGSGKTYEVINSGVGNYNTRMEVAYFLDRGRLLKPDVVVLNYFINDAEPTPRRKNNPLDEISYAAVLLSGAFDTVARSYFGRADWKAYYRGLYVPQSPDWAATQDAIKQLIDYCMNAGIKVMVVNYPELHELRDYPFSSVTTAIAQISAEEGVPFVDLLPSVQDKDPASLWVSPGDAHPNAVANTEYAMTLARALRANFPNLFSGPMSASRSETTP
jgi:lysophospholipase L1-like esterase